MSNRVHATAIIGAQVELADDAEVGAYSVLQGRVRIGARTRIHHHVSIDGETTIGADNEFFPFASIGHIAQDVRAGNSEGASLEIGNRNIFRESTTVNLGCHDQRRTIIGDDNLFMACAHVAHDCHIDCSSIIANNVLLAGHVHVGARAVIGGGSAVHQFCRIGELSMTGGCSRVIDDVPPFSLINGNPSLALYINRVGLKRAELSRDRIDRISELFRVCYREGHTHSTRVKALSALAGNGPDERLFFDFVSAPSKRTLIRHRPARAG